MKLPSAIRRQERTAYGTIVRELASGTVLHAAQGKDGNVLKDFLLVMRKFEFRIRRIPGKDQSRPFRSWLMLT